MARRAARAPPGASASSPAERANDVARTALRRGASEPRASDEAARTHGCRISTSIGAEVGSAIVANAAALITMLVVRLVDRARRRPAVGATGRWRRSRRRRGAPRGTPLKTHVWDRVDGPPEDRRARRRHGAVPRPDDGQHRYPAARAVTGAGGAEELRTDVAHRVDRRRRRRGGRRRRRPRRPRRRSGGPSPCRSRLTSQTAGSATIREHAGDTPAAGDRGRRTSGVAPCSGGRSPAPVRVKDGRVHEPRATNASATSGEPNAVPRCVACRRATRPTSTPCTSARRAPTNGTQAGRLRLPRWGTGARYGLSVSTSRRSSGVMAAASRTSGAPLNVTIREKLTGRPRGRGSGGPRRGRR